MPLLPLENIVSAVFLVVNILFTFPKQQNQSIEKLPHQIIYNGLHPLNKLAIVHRFQVVDFDEFLTYSLAYTCKKAFVYANF
ncbi:hypothetical protein GCM10008018_30940 [Paenibacillus marchantiophytorum]|uniref:Secreted protein n=1 Tax=Paenibacillus marchantiophytorum TaxID=1619310 RepID=A0ABQ1ERB2_9BACL|nr:hypothetical protein GCM10008018_30940 [Paenibacillus marchantiophytorum]